jgi:transposase-like protein
MTATHDDIIKSDRRGRLRYTQEQRDALVSACQASGLSTPRFAAIHGVKYQTLAAWVHRRNREAKPARSCLPQSAPFMLVPVEREGPASSGVSSLMEVNLPGGATLRVTAPGHIPLAAALIRELASPRPC